MDQSLSLHLKKRLWPWLLGAIAICRLASLCAYPLLDPTESRYTKIPMLMVTSGDWVVPHISADVPFWGKPPLAFWITALNFSVFGISDFTSRLGSYLAAVITTLLTVLLAQRLKQSLSPDGKGESHLSFGCFCGAILASTFLFNVSAGFAQTDSALAATVTLSMVSIPMAALAERRKDAVMWGYLFFVGLGLALLTKGPLAVALAVIALGAWSFWKKSWRTLGILPWFTGLILMLLIAVPWHIAAEMRSPGFLDYYIVGEHWKRFLVPGWKSLYGTSHELPPATIWFFLLVAASPWLPALAWIAWRKRAYGIGDSVQRVWLAYLFCWFLAPVVLFTPTRNVMITYVMPGLPAMAILCGWVIWSLWEKVGAEPLTVTDMRPLQRTLLALGLFSVPIGYLVTAFFIMPGECAWLSQGPILKEYHKADPEGRAEVVYFGDMPESAYIYGKGRFEVIGDKAEKRVHEEENDGQQTYFVLHKSDDGKLRDRVATPTEEVARVGRYILCRTAKK